MPSDSVLYVSPGGWLALGALAFLAALLALQGLGWLRETRLERGRRKAQRGHERKLSKPGRFHNAK